MPDRPNPADLLWAPVPTPKAPVPEPQESWRTLRLGQWLEQQLPVVVRVKYPEGTRWFITAVTSQGVQLTLSEDHRITLWWSDPLWQSTFRRIRKPAKPRGVRRVAQGS